MVFRLIYYCKPERVTERNSRLLSGCCSRTKILSQLGRFILGNRLNALAYQN